MAKKKKTPLIFSSLRAFFGALSKVSPKLALEFAFHLFFRPRGRLKQVVMPDVETSLFYIDVNGKRVSVQSWGSGPLVILVHGWEGRGMQWHKFIPALASAGYRAVTFDAPAHGASTGKSTNLLEFSATIRAIRDVLGEPYAVVGHSMGGAAMGIAFDEGLSGKKAVAISAPAKLDFAIEQFSKMINLSGSVRNRMRDRISKHLKRAVETLNFDGISERLTMPALIIHDKYDRIVPVENGYSIHRAWNGSRLAETSGLGHVRILEDDSVIQKVVSFIDTEPV
ncbi:MAG: alpha/beta fold hydrolase [Calditrichia bacterium]